MLPVGPDLAHVLSGGSCEEEGGLQVGVDLPVPGLLGHVLEGLPLEHASHEHDGLDASQRLGRTADQSRVCVEVVQVQADGLMWPTRQRLDDPGDSLLLEIDRADASAHVGEGPAVASPMPWAAPVTMTP